MSEYRKIADLRQRYAALRLQVEELHRDRDQLQKLLDMHAKVCTQPAPPVAAVEGTEPAVWTEYHRIPITKDDEAAAWKAAAESEGDWEAIKALDEIFTDPFLNTTLNCGTWFAQKEPNGNQWTVFDEHGNLTRGSQVLAQDVAQYRNLLRTIRNHVDKFKIVKARMVAEGLLPPATPQPAAAVEGTGEPKCPQCGDHRWVNIGSTTTTNDGGRYQCQCGFLYNWCPPAPAPPAEWKVVQRKDTAEWILEIAGLKLATQAEAEAAAAKVNGTCHHISTLQREHKQMAAEISRLQAELAAAEKDRDENLKLYQEEVQANMNRNK
jgi:predicted RNA-binding Zn-ribbon protein involved in translation (DUF1610 family)